MDPKLQTLCFLFRDKQLLLGMKKRGFGAGRWNGFGGKVLPNETLEACARRECTEESGLTPTDLMPRGCIQFRFDDGLALDVHIFSATAWVGELIESEEMRPEWHSVEHIPYEHMWPDDPYWLPLLLAGKNVTGTCYFQDAGTIRSHSLREQP